MIDHIQVQWFGTHHAQDAENLIRSHLEAGGDEGPLLIVPWGSRAGRSLKSGQQPTLFKDVDCYIAHLTAHSDTVEGDRWAGLVRGVRQNDRALALGVMARIAKLIAPHPPRPHRGPSRRPRPPAEDYAVLVGPHPLSADIEVENFGDGFDEISATFPALTENMLLAAD